MSDNVVERGMRYLKNNGVKATLKRMKNGPAPIPPKKKFHLIKRRMKRQRKLEKSH